MAVSPPLHEPRQVMLFSGHMIDAPDRPVPRFPAAREPLAKRAIDDVLRVFDAGPADLAVTSGACGGDLLFCEAVLARGVPLELFLPFEPPVFAVKSVDFAGADWHRRFEAVCRAAGHVDAARAADGVDPYEHTNLRMLAAAQAHGAEKVRFVCLWDGRGGDGPGGTAHMAQQVREAGGRTHWLDTTSLWELPR